MTIGERIKNARERCGLSQAKLARLVGRSQSAVAEWETGESAPRRDIVPKIAVALEVSEEYLELGGLTDRDAPYRGGDDHRGARKDSAQIDRDAEGCVYASIQGKQGLHIVDFNHVIEHRPKPARWRNVRDLYAFHIVDDGLSPRLRQGELIWVHPGRQPRPGEEAVFVEREPQTGVRTAMVRLFTGATPTRHIVHQLNPDKEVEIPKTNWDAQLIVAIDLNR